MGSDVNAVTNILQIVGRLTGYYVTSAGTIRWFLFVWGRNVWFGR